MQQNRREAALFSAERRKTIILGAVSLFLGLCLPASAVGIDLRPYPDAMPAPVRV